MEKPEETKFIVTRRGLIYTLSCNGNELVEQQFRSIREAVDYYRCYITNWDRAVLIYEGEDE